MRIAYDIQQTGSARPFSLDPTLGISPNDPLYYLIYGRFMRPLADGTLEPDLAETVTITSPTTIDIVLRDGMTWHDGAPFDAQSVKDGLERTALAERIGTIPPAYYSLSSVDVVDPTTARLNISDGTAASWFDRFISSWETSIVRPGTDFSAPVGAGPMSVTAYEPGVNLELDRFDAYWNADAVNFAEIEIVAVSGTTPEAGTNALRADQVDATPTVVAQIPALSGNLEVKSVQTGNLMTYGMICKSKPPLDDADVRKAINKAVDRDSVNEAVYGGTAAPATLLFPEGHRFYSEDVADELAYDPDGARELLQSSGNENLSFDLYFNDQLGVPDVAQILEAQLAEVGIDANLVPAPDFVGQFLGVQAPGAGLVPGVGGVNALNGISGAALSNPCKYSDPELDALAAKLAVVSASSEEAQQLWDQINVIYAEDALALPIIFPAVLGAYNTETLEIGDVWPVKAPGVFVPDIYTSHSLG